MELFITGMALVLIFEGIPYFINPTGMQSMARLLSDADPKALRIGGFFLMAAGLGILYVFIGN